MRIQPNRRLATVATAIVAAAAACQSTPELTASERESVRDSIDSYLAYERGDCGTVLRQTESEILETWDLEELRHSTRLLRGFCLELGGEPSEARSVYRNLILRASQSFAASDARERFRILEIAEEDPAHARWMRDAHSRADASTSPRTPVERVPARVPPMARMAGIEGFAVVEFGVNPRGEPVEPLIADSQPPWQKPF